MKRIPLVSLIVCSVTLLSLSGCEKKSTIPQVVAEETFTPMRPEWANKKDFSDGKFAGVKVGYEQAMNDRDDPSSPLDMPFFASAAWKNHGPNGDELSWKSGFVQGMHEGFEEGECMRSEQQELLERSNRITIEDLERAKP